MFSFLIYQQQDALNVAHIAGKIWIEEGDWSKCNIPHDCAGDLNVGLKAVKFKVFNNLAILNHNKYFELLNVPYFSNDTQTAKQIAKNRCQMICKVSYSFRRGVGHMYNKFETSMQTIAGSHLQVCRTLV